MSYCWHFGSALLDLPLMRRWYGVDEGATRKSSTVPTHARRSCFAAFFCLSALAFAMSALKSVRHRHQNAPLLVQRSLVSVFDLLGPFPGSFALHLSFILDLVPVDIRRHEID